MTRGDPPASPRRLADLRRSVPGDTTLQNLLQVLRWKQELCVRLPVYEYEAINDGNETAAGMFHGLLEDERRSFDELLVQLRTHLNELSLSPAAAGVAVVPESGCG